jgi:hypothetical protein
MLAFVLAGCTSGPVGEPHRSGSDLPFDSHRVVLELNQAWSSTGPGMGAYGDVFSFEAEPSLFQTGWHLRVASAIGASIQNVSPSEATGWIDGALTKDSSGLRRLDSIYLAIGALRGLGQQIPSTALTGIGALRVGDLYASDPGREPSWSATALAVKALTEAGGTPPRTLQARVIAALPAATAANDLNAWAEQLIPVWTLADQLVPESARQPQETQLATSLTRLRDAIASQSLSEITVFIAAQITAIARANHFTGLEIPISAFSRLITPLGYLTTDAGSPMPSMLNTYNAISMGYAGPGTPARQALATYLNWSAAPKGWREDFSQPGPEASFYAWEVSKALGETAPRQALEAQVTDWLNHAATSPAGNGGGSEIDLYFMVLLGQALEIVVPLQLVDKIREELQSDGAGLPTPDLVGLARLSQLLAIQADGPMSDRWRALEQGLDLSVTRQAQEAFTLAQALDDKQLQATLAAHESAQNPGPLWGSRSGAPAPDLQSTAVGAVILGRTPVQAAAVRTTFADQRGFWLYSPSNLQGNVVDPRTLYLGLWLTGGGVDPGGVI